MNRRKALTLLLATPAALAAVGCTNIFSPETKIPLRPVPPPPRVAPLSSAELVEYLGLAYRKRDWDTFAALLHPDFAFVLSAAAPDGTATWGRAEELAIHRRMFRPGSIAGSEARLPPELWLTSVDVGIYAATGWEALPDPGGPWEHALYNATMFFETQGDRDFRVESQQELVVGVNLSVPRGEPGRFLLYRWIEHGPATGSLLSTPASWSEVKLLYRVAPPRSAPLRVRNTSSGATRI